MATQRLIVAGIAGETASAVEALFRNWQNTPAPDRAAVDVFCERLRANGEALPVVSFCEWVDRWLMGNLVPGPGAVEGKRFQATCLSPSQALSWAEQCGNQFPEQEILAARLREPSRLWGALAPRLVIVVAREVLGISTTDHEIRAALQGVPGWLSRVP
jgi:hypothetical protein